MQFPKSSILRDKKYLKWVRSQPCVVTGRMGEDIDPAHIRHGLGGGMGMKPSDDCVLPLSHNLHERQHSMGEMTFWLLQANESPEFLMRCVKAYAREQYKEWKNEQ